MVQFFEKKYWTYNLYFDFPFTLALTHLRTSAHKATAILSDLNQNLDFLDTFWGTFSNIGLHKNPSAEGRVVPRRQTDGQT